MENEYLCSDGVGMTPDLVAGCVEGIKDAFQTDKTNNKIMTHRFLTALIAALAMALTLTPASAQKNNESDDYNLRKAYEVLNEDMDVEKAMELVRAQLESTPDNVNALLLRTRLFRNKNQYGDALADINHAIKVNKPKKTEIPQSTLYWWRAYVYSDMDEEEKSEADLKTATDLARKNKDGNLQGISFDYARCLFNLEKYDESEAVANSMLKDDEADQSASDIKGKKYYQVANGSISEGTVITLREVKIGEAVLHNVDASVVGSQNAPLLFGQSAMEKFGKITIDNDDNKLIIKQ